jgi:hypothetical protein
LLESLLERWRPELRLWPEKNGRCGRFAASRLDSCGEGEEDVEAELAGLFDLDGAASVAGDARRQPGLGFGRGIKEIEERESRGASECRRESRAPGGTSLSSSERQESERGVRAASDVDERHGDAAPLLRQEEDQDLAENPLDFFSQLQLGPFLNFFYFF